MKTKPQKVMTMETLGDGIKIWEAEQKERTRKEDEAWAALPQAEKDRIIQARKVRSAKDLAPHRVDLTDDDEEE